MTETVAKKPKLELDEENDELNKNSGKLFLYHFFSFFIFWLDDKCLGLGFIYCLRNRLLNHVYYQATVRLFTCFARPISDVDSS